VRHHEDGLGVARHLQGLRFAPKVPMENRRLLAVPPNFALPDAVDNALFDQIPVYDQGQVGRCTGEATRTIVSMVVLKEIGRYIEFSADFPYAMTRLEEGTPLDEDSGCAIPDAMRGLCVRGICREEVWPTGDFTAAPSDEAKADALLHKGLLFYHCPDVFTIRAALAQGFGVTIGMTVFENMMSPEAARSGLVLYPERGEKALGGHNVVIRSYDIHKQVGGEFGSLKCRGSWSEGCGIEGDFWVPIRYAAEGLMTDAESLRGVAA